MTVKGSKNPLKLFTITIESENNVEMKDRYQYMQKKDKRNERVKEKRAVKKRVLGDIVDSYLLYERDDDIVELRRTSN